MVAELQLQVGDYRDQVRVAASLAKTVDRPLHLRRARMHSSEGVGDRHLRVVMTMDTDGAVHRGARGTNASFDFMGQASAVGVAERDQSHARVVNRLKAGERKFGVMNVAVEEVLGVEDRFGEVLF